MTPYSQLFPIVFNFCDHLNFIMLNGAIDLELRLKNQFGSTSSQEVNQFPNIDLPHILNFILYCFNSFFAEGPIQKFSNVNQLNNHLIIYLGVQFFITFNRISHHSLPLGARSQLFPVEIRSPMVPMSTESSRVKYGTFSSAQSESSGRRINSSFVVSSPHSQAQVSTQIDLVSHIEISSNNVTVLWKFDSNSVTHPLLYSPTNTYLFEVSD